MLSAMIMVSFRLRTMASVNYSLLALNTSAVSVTAISVSASSLNATSRTTAFTRIWIVLCGSCL